MITAGEVLKDKRESLGRSLDTVSLETKIQKRFLQYIENNQFSYYDSEVFLTGFIKIYANYLDLDTKKILALYRRSNPVKKPTPITEKNKKIFRGKIQQNFLTPKNLIAIFLVVFLIAIIGYIGLQIYKFQTPPTLNITEPLQDSNIVSEDISIKGSTELNSIVEINGTPVKIDNSGNFEKTIELNEGVNIITVKARKNSNNTLETIETRKVTFTKKVKEPEVAETIKNTITLEIVDSPAWIKFDLDNENKLSQVVEPSMESYTFNQKVHIITGRVNNTKLYWNNKAIEWKPNQITGVAELTCEIVNNLLTCN